MSVKFWCLLLVTLLVLHHSCSVSVSQICQHRCLYGRGGILCNCNAMHFAGKRNKPAGIYATPLSPTEPLGRHGGGIDQVINGGDGDGRDIKGGNQRSRLGGDADDAVREAVRASYSTSHLDNVRESGLSGKTFLDPAGFYANADETQPNNAESASLFGDRQTAEARGHGVYLYPDAPIDNNSPTTALNAHDISPGNWDRAVIDNFLASLQGNARLGKGFSSPNNKDGILYEGVNNSEERGPQTFPSPALLLERLPYLVFADKPMKSRAGRQHKSEVSGQRLPAAVGLHTSSNAVHRNPRRTAASDSSNDEREEVLKSRTQEHIAQLRRIFNQAISKSLPEVVFRKQGV